MFHKNAQIHAAAAMGLSLCIGYIIFGLVDVMFGWNMCNVFYTMAIAVFMAFIVNKNKELAATHRLQPQ
jgi:O-antigen ligase